MRYGLGIVLFAALTGCGVPLVTPMVPKLHPDEQAVVDRMWDNMLTPVQREDRQVLLDANVSLWMYVYGIDRLQMKSEKSFAGGTALMEIDCDRANPDVDQFVITVFDQRGRTIRRERYTRAEVEESSKTLLSLMDETTLNATTEVSELGATTRKESSKMQAFRLMRERRQAAVMAATQPARLAPPSVENERK